MGFRIVETSRTTWKKLNDDGSLTSCVLYGVIHTLAGIGVLAVAIWLYVDSSKYLQGKDDTYNYTYFTAVYILMAAGSIMTFIGFLGCCGALRESQCMLGTFFVFLLVVLAAEVTGGVWAWMHKDDAADFIPRQLSMMMKKQYPQVEVVKRAIDAMQHDLGCCGISGPSDWRDARFNKDDKSTLEIGVESVTGLYEVPSSCCKKGLSTEECEISRRVQPAGALFNRLYTTGCAKIMQNHLEEHLTLVMGIGIGLGIVQILGLVFSMVLCCALRNGVGTLYKA